MYSANIEMHSANIKMIISPSWILSFFYQLAFLLPTRLHVHRKSLHMAHRILAAEAEKNTFEVELQARWPCRRCRADHQGNGDGRLQTRKWLQALGSGSAVSKPHHTLPLAHLAPQATPGHLVVGPTPAHRDE